MATQRENQRKQWYRVYVTPIARGTSIARATGLDVGWFWHAFGPAKDDPARYTRVSEPFVRRKHAMENAEQLLGGVTWRPGSSQRVARVGSFGELLSFDEYAMRQELRRPPVQLHKRNTRATAESLLARFPGLAQWQIRAAVPQEYDDACPDCGAVLRRSGCYPDGTADGFCILSAHASLGSTACTWASRVLVVDGRAVVIPSESSS